MLGSFHITTVRKVPIRVHFTALLLLPWINNWVSQFPNIPSQWHFPITLLLILFFLGSVALHELGHTLVAQRYHMRVRDITLTPIGGVARLEGDVHDPHHEIRIALAGPYVSLLLSGLGYAGFQLAILLQQPQLAVFLYVIFWLNLLLFGFNLIPCFPMDGGRVLRGWLAQRRGMLEATRVAASLGKGISIFFMFYGFTTGHTNLLIIGFFIFLAAGSELRMMLLKNKFEQSFGPNNPFQPFAGNESKPEIEVSPPPYAAESQRKALPGFIGDVVGAATDLLGETLRATR